MTGLDALMLTQMLIYSQIKGLKYQKWRTKQMILDIDPKQKKKKRVEFFELDEELDEAWILEHQAFLVQEQRTKIEKKFQKENEKLVADGEKEMKAKELEQRLEVVDDLEKKFKKENKSKKVDAEGKGPSVEKCEAAIKKLDDRIATMLLQAEDREGNKEVALGTSKIVSDCFYRLTGMLTVSRIISTPVLQSSSLRSSMSPSKSSSRRLFERSSIGPSTRSRTTTSGSFKVSLFTDATLHTHMHKLHLNSSICACRGIGVLAWYTHSFAHLHGGREHGIAHS